jgi:hypothetical protein
MHVVGRTHHSLIFSQHFLEWLFFSKYSSHYNISSNTVVIESKKTGKSSARSWCWLLLLTQSWDEHCITRSTVLSLVVFWVVVSFAMALVIHKVFEIVSHECLHQNDGGRSKTSRADNWQRRPSLAAQPWVLLWAGPQFCYVHVEGFAQKQQSEGMYRWLASSFALASYVDRVC